MRLLKFNVTAFLLFIGVGCTYIQSDIDKAMKKGLISFSQKNIGMQVSVKGDTMIRKLHFDGEIVERKGKGEIVITYYTTETAMPYFEAGAKVLDSTLFLYYQDVKFVPVKCIDFYKLQYTLKPTISYKKIEVVRLNSINKGFAFK